MEKQIIPIKGMHCKACQVVVGEELGQLPGVRRVKVSLKKKQAVILGTALPSQATIAAAVERAGYKVGREDLPWISHNEHDYVHLAVAVMLLVAIILAAKLTGLTKLGSIHFADPTSYAVIILIGITAGFSTCMALVGGLVLGVSARHAELYPEATTKQKFMPHLFFNLGRVSGFFLLGGLVGLIGSAFQMSAPLIGLLTIVVGIVMMVLGFKLTEIFPRLSAANLTLPAWLGRLIGTKRGRREYSHRGSFTAGALSFFLPCGFTQTMQIYAMSTGQFWSGALIMALFALGTSPGLIGIGGLTSLMQNKKSGVFFKFAGLAVASLALVNLYNGATLLGWRLNLPQFKGVQGIDYNDSKAQQAPPPRTVAGAGGEIQLITTVYRLQEDIQPAIFTVKAGLPVRLEVDVQEDGQGCMSTIMIPGLYNRAVYLKGGEILTLDFTPRRTGEYTITCAMGVPRGTIKVI